MFWEKKRKENSSKRQAAKCVGAKGYSSRLEAAMSACPELRRLLCRRDGWFGEWQREFADSPQRKKRSLTEMFEDRSTVDGDCAAAMIIVAYEDDDPQVRAFAIERMRRMIADVMRLHISDIWLDQAFYHAFETALRYAIKDTGDSDEDACIRMDAIKHISDKTKLESMLLSEKDAAVREKIKLRLRTLFIQRIEQFTEKDDVLKVIAQESEDAALIEATKQHYRVTQGYAYLFEDEAIREAARRQLSYLRLDNNASQEDWIQIATSCDDSEKRKIAAGHITDKAVLYKIAKDPNRGVRSAAQAQFKKLKQEQAKGE